MGMVLRAIALAVGIMIVAILTDARSTQPLIFVSVLMLLLVKAVEWITKKRL